MAIQFQYNKTSLQALDKNLKMRVRALPTIKNKESALRMEVKRAKDDINKLEKEIEQRIVAYDKMLALWGEFDSTLLSVEDVRMSIRKIAGVRIPVLEEVVYKTRPFSLFNSPKWFADGLTQLKELAQVGIEQEFYAEKLNLLGICPQKDHSESKSF